MDDTLTRLRGRLTCISTTMLAPQLRLPGVYLASYRVPELISFAVSGCGEERILAVSCPHHTATTRKAVQMPPIQEARV
jgi:hypothetical protein